MLGYCSYSDHAYDNRCNWYWCADRATRRGNGDLGVEYDYDYWKSGGVRYI